jgi:hypothetical protein
MIVVSTTEKSDLGRPYSRLLGQRPEEPGGCTAIWASGGLRGIDEWESRQKREALAEKWGKTGALGMKIGPTPWR